MAYVTHFAWETVHVATFAFVTIHKWRHALEGEGCPKSDDSTDRLREWDSDKGGVKKSKNFVNVI